jgi:hypothetical protein
MSEAVYLLCTLTAALCSGLLLRAYGKSRERLLFWSGVCFVGLAVNNAILFTEMVLVSVEDLWPVRSATALVAVGVLLYGLVWESR